MPKIDLTVPKEALDAETLAEPPGQLADALLRWEKAPDNAFFRSMAWTLAREIDGAAAAPAA